MIFVRDVQRATAAHYGIPEEAMREPIGVRNNVWTYARPRQVAMSLSFRLTDHGKTHIGRLFGGRAHTTVLHAVRAVDRRRASDPALHRAMRKITLELLGGRG